MKENIPISTGNSSKHLGAQKNALGYAKMGADALMRKFTVDELPPKNRFHYHQGVFLSRDATVPGTKSECRWKFFLILF